MIGGISSNGYGPLVPDRSVQRERADQGRTDDSNTRATRVVEAGSSADFVDPQLLERRVQARKAAEDVRLEQFRVDDVPFANAKALEVFTGIASQPDDDVELAGIDIRI